MKIDNILLDKLSFYAEGVIERLGELLVGNVAKSLIITDKCLYLPQIIMCYGYDCCEKS